uniref:Uncharacterized protein n=1 Tax=Fagus sylvatica TaxID=28930 RepID=A0A2N9G8I1_FAGSY
MPPTPYYRHIVTMYGVLRWSGGFQITLLVPREVEVSFNDDSMFQAANDTCHHSIGRRAKDVVSFAENNLGPPPLEGYVSSDSVLHRLAVELYSIVYPALSSWEGVRSRMAANEAEWSLPLSDESCRRVYPMSHRGGSVTQDDIDRMRRRYQIPDDVVLRIPDSDERACCPKYEGDVAFYEADLKGRSTFSPFVIADLSSSNGSEDLTVDEFLFCYEPCQIALSRGFWTFKNRDANTRIVQGLPSSDRIWKDKYFFVCGDNWERLPQEDPRDFVGVRSRRILRILDIEDRRYNIFIEPDLLASFSLGPVPNFTVKALARANKKRVNKMKLNKSRLRQLAQSGEVAADPVVLKRKRAGEGSSRQTEEVIARPPPRKPFLSSRTFHPSSWAKAAFTSKDMDDYAAAHTEDVHYLLVHLLMRGLNEAMVVSKRCMAVEEEIATLRAKYMADEAEIRNAKRAVLELTKERKGCAWMSKIERAKEAAVSEFRSSDAFEDIVTRYFLSGFEAFRKQAVQRFPGLDFLALQPYDDVDSVADASQDQAGDDHVSSK